MCSRIEVGWCCQDLMGNKWNVQDNSSRKDVVAWYERKTESILRKYGPGPLVHFHTGIVEPETAPAPDFEGLRLQLTQSQEKLLLEASQFWEAKRHLHGVVLDVGCGLGGSSIFFAQEYGAHVFALTNVPGHLKYIVKFAAQAGVAEKVTPILGDAHMVPGDHIFDAAVAIESSCYLYRESWFHHLSQRVQPDGHVFIADCFVRNDEIRKPFDSYWLTRIGTLNEYISAARGAGFKMEGLLDLTSRTALFWEFSILYSRCLLTTIKVHMQEEQRLKRSIKWQTQFLPMWKDGKIMYALLRLVHS